MLRLCVLATLLFSSSAGAHPAVDVLLGSPLPPAETAAAIETLVAADLAQDELAPLFTTGLHRSVAIAGATVVQRRLAAGHTAEATLAWRAFLASKFTLLAHDPDVFERLLLGLQQADPAVLATLPGHEPAGLQDRAWSELRQYLLEPLGQGISFTQPRSELSAARWSAQLLAQDHALVQLQTDSGDRAFRLLESLQVDYLTDLIRSDDDAVVDVAVEAWQQRFSAWPQPYDALQALDMTDRLPASRPLGPRAPKMLRPREGAILVSLEDRYELSGSAASHVSPLWWLAALPLIWLAALRVFPQHRAALFRVGAVGFGLGLLGGVEGGLALAGVEPLMRSQPQVYSYRDDPLPPAGEVFEPVAPHHSRLEDGDGRHRVFAVAPPGPRLVVVGESSAHGSNHLAEEAFAGLLAEALDVDVINAGLGGAISDEILSTGTQVLAYGPDILVLYFGFNDLNRLANVAELRAFSPAKLRLREWLDRSRLVRILADVVPAAWLQPEPDHAFRDHGGNSLSTEERATVRALAIHHAARNMARLIQEAEARGIDVVVAIQAQNEAMCPPGGGSDRPSCVVPELREIALEAASFTGVTLVDVPAALRDHAGGPAGHVYFWDEIHPSRIGHAVIAAALQPTLHRILKRRAEE